MTSVAENTKAVVQLAGAARAKGHRYVLLVVPVRRKMPGRVTVLPGLRGEWKGDCAGGSLVDLDLDDFDRWKTRQEKKR